MWPVYLHDSTRLQPTICFGSEEWWWEERRPFKRRLSRLRSTSQLNSSAWQIRHVVPKKVLEWMTGCVHERQCLDEIYSVFFSRKTSQADSKRTRPVKVLKSLPLWSKNVAGMIEGFEWLSACSKPARVLTRHSAHVLVTLPKKKQPGEQWVFGLFSRPAK